jgi:hypothetical protein
MHKASAVLANTVINRIVKIANSVESLVDLGLVAINGRAVFNTVMDTRQ